MARFAPDSEGFDNWAHSTEFLGRVKRAFEALSSARGLRFLNYEYSGQSFGNSSTLLALEGVWVYLFLDRKEGAYAERKDGIVTTEISIPIPRRQRLNLGVFLTEITGRSGFPEDECSPEEASRLIEENYDLIAKTLREIELKARKENHSPGREYSGRASERYDHSLRLI